jgi:putative Holliday junction resolvase
MLSQRGVRGKKQRAVVDQAAAVEILQAWLDGRAAAIQRRSDQVGKSSPEDVQ